MLDTPPTAWRDMWKPEMRGIAAINDALADQAMQMANLAFGRDPTPVDDVTFEHLTALRPNLISLWSTVAQAEQLFRSGEVGISPLWNGRVFKLIDRGVPLDFVVPEEGFFARWNAYTVPRNAANPDLAMEFIDYVMNEERQLALAVNLSYGSPNKNVVYPNDDVRRRIVVGTPENIAKVVPENFEEIADNSEDWSRRWNQWKAARGGA